jgi:hypothetical protein
MVDSIKPIHQTESADGISSHDRLPANHSFYLNADDSTDAARMRLQREALTLTPDELLMTYDKHKGQLDANHDGFVERDEFNVYDLRGASPRETLMMDALRLYAGKIEEQSNDEFGDENNGFTDADVKQLTEAWDDNANLKLIREIDFMASQSLWGRQKMGIQYESLMFNFRDEATHVGGVAGATVGMILGGAAVGGSGMLLAPLVPVGYFAGGYAGQKLGAGAAWLAPKVYTEDQFTRNRIDDGLQEQDFGFDWKLSR